MITAVEIENFKGIRERTRIEIKPITLLFGPNSAGKSTLLHALQLAREIFTRRNVDVDVTDGGAGFIDLGGFRNYVHGRDITRIVALRFELDLSGTDFFGEYPITTTTIPLPGGRGEEFDVSMIGDDIESGWVELKIGWSATRGRPYVAEYSVGLNGEHLATIGALHDLPDAAFIEPFNLLHPLFRWPNGSSVEEANNFGIVDFLYPGCLTLVQRQYLRAEPLPSTAQPGTNAKQQVVFLAGEEYPCGKAYRLIKEAPPDAVRLHDVIASREPNSLTVALHALVFCSSDYYPADRPPDEAELENVESLFSEVMAQERALFARKEATFIPIQDQADALPDFTRPIPFVFPVAIDGEEFSESNLDVLGKLLSRLLLVPGRSLRANLDELRYVGPVRDAVPRNFEPPRFPNPRRWAGGLAAWDELARGQNDLTTQVDDWLGDDERLNTGFGIRVECYRELPTDHQLSALLERGGLTDDADADTIQKLLTHLPVKRRLLLFSRATQQTMQPTDVGQGITQVVPVIVAVLSPFPDAVVIRGGLVAIEQPELHLQPAAQVGLGDLFIVAVDKLTRGRLIIETHSEHLLLRLLRRIRQTTEGTLPQREYALDPNQLAVICFEPPTDLEPTRIYRLRVDAQGEFLDPWPRGFFDERAEELFGS